MSAVRLETVLEGHTAPVRSLVFSPNGTTLATAADDGIVRVWDLEHGTSQKLHTNHRRALTIALSRRGQFLATAGQAAQPTLWDVKSGQPLGALPHPGSGIVGLASLPDRDAFGVAMDRRVMLWDAPSGVTSTVTMERFAHDELYYAEALAFSSDGRTLATGSTSIGWERGSQSPFASVRLWEMPSGTLRHTFPPTPPMAKLKFSPSGRVVAACGPAENPHDVHAWAVTTGESLAMLQVDGAGGWFRDIAFSPDERFLVIAMTPSAGDEARLLLMEPTGFPLPPEKKVLTLLTVRTPATQLALAESGTRMATADDRGVRVWSLV